MNDFKVRCVKSETACFTVGNIYKVKGNNIIGDKAVPVSIIGCSCIEDINRTIASQFELVEESEATEDEPKFKVGDIVHHCNDSKGYNKVVESISINSKYPYECRDLRGNQAFDWYSEKELTLVGEKTSEPDYKTMFENCKKQLREAFDEIENLESKKVTPKLKSEPNYKELYEKAMDELQAMEYTREVNALKELKFEVDRLKIANKTLREANIEAEKKIRKLRVCLGKQYKFIDKLLPERIEV